MKKLFTISIAFAALAAACKKKENRSVTPDEKYTCVCHVSVTFVDHCGEADASDQSSFIYSSQRTEAEKSCKQQESTVASTGTITTKTCELR